MTKHEDAATSLAILVLVASVIGLVLIAGCATQPRYEAAVQVESSGDDPVVVASFKLVN